MRLRVLSGELRGRRLDLPADLGDFRPTSARARQACINRIRPRIRGSLAADVCAGSGIVGLELLSEGAREVHFVENDFRRSAEIRKHGAILGVADRSSVVEQDVETFLSRATSRYDIIFYDPPYDDDAPAVLPLRLAGLLSPGGILIYERSKRRRSTGGVSAAWDIDERTYGDTVKEFWTKKTPEAASAF
jgi:16S rRNA (guanine966-N2)-methyltransferase